MQDSTASDPPDTKKMRSSPPGMLRGERARQFLGRLVLEMQAVGEGRLVHLPLHRVQHVAVAVADIDGHRPARAVDETAAVCVQM